MSFHEFARIACLARSLSSFHKHCVLMFTLKPPNQSTHQRSIEIAMWQFGVGFKSASHLGLINVQNPERSEFDIQNNFNHVSSPFKVA